MRTKLFVAIAALLWITASCKREESEAVQPSAQLPGKAKELPLYAVSPADIANRRQERKTGARTMSILDTKKDDVPFFLFVPEVTDHEPFLLADARYNMTSGSPSTRPVLEEPSAAPKFDVMKLDDDDLSINPPGNENLSYTIGGTGSCPLLLKELQSLRWAPSMSDVLGKPVSINPEFLKPDPLSSGLAARMRIENGYLASTPTYYHLWQFKENQAQTSGHVQMLTARIAHEFTVDLPAGTTVLTILSKNFAAGSSPTTLVTLEPYLDKVEFFIGTTVQSERLPGTGTASDEDKHYHELYNTVVDATGAAVTSNVHPFKVVGAQCVPPTTTLVNCGPDRP
jgi:hypothetical protein